MLILPTSLSAKTINQVPFSVGGVVTDKFTRGYTTTAPDIQRVLFGETGGVVALRSAGAGPATLASVVDWKIDVQPTGDAEKLRWLSQLGAQLTGETEREVVRSWQIRLEQHRFYHSFGP